jgi:hypothetical protein
MSTLSGQLRYWAYVLGALVVAQIASIVITFVLSLNVTAAVIATVLGDDLATAAAHLVGDVVFAVVFGYVVALGLASFDRASEPSGPELVGGLVGGLAAFVMPQVVTGPLVTFMFREQPDATTAIMRSDVVRFVFVVGVYVAVAGLAGLMAFAVARAYSRQAASNAEVPSSPSSEVKLPQGGTHTSLVPAVGRRVTIMRDTLLPARAGVDEWQFLPVQRGASGTVMASTAAGWSSHVAAEDPRGGRLSTQGAGVEAFSIWMAGREYAVPMALLYSGHIVVETA